MNRNTTVDCQVKRVKKSEGGHGKTIFIIFCRLLFTDRVKPLTGEDEWNNSVDVTNKSANSVSDEAIFVEIQF